MRDQYGLNNNHLKTNNNIPLFKTHNKALPVLNLGKTISYSRPILVPESSSMFTRKENKDFELIERLKTLEEKFDGRDDEPIIGKAAEEFAIEAERHPERYEFLSDWLVKELNKHSQKPRMILDAGSGPGILTQAIARKIVDAEVLGVDISSDMLRIAKRDNALERINFISGDARKMQEIAHRPADAVISRRMIHRVDDLEKTLESIVKTLKPGGIMLNYSFRKPTEVDDRKSFLKAAEHRAEFNDLHAAFVRAVLNAPTLDDYQRVCKKIACKLDLKNYSIKIFPFDVGIVFVR